MSSPRKAGLLHETITPPEFRSRVGEIIGLRVTRPWRGYGSALFLELGKLTEMRLGPTPRHPEGRISLKGQATVMIEWSWRVERKRSIAFGSWSTDRKMNAGIRRLKGARVTAISIEGRLPELLVTLTEGLWVHAFSTVEGQPEWAMFLPDGSWLKVERGTLCREQRRRRVRTRGG